MIVALDTDVLVHWLMRGAIHHDSVQRRIQAHLCKPAARIAIAPQCLNEFVHVVSDARRFVHPLTMSEAISLASQIWRAHEVVPIFPTVVSVARTWDLLASYSLGRKRILDTALAATLESAGVSELWSLNHQDFAVFSFLRVFDPSQ